MCRSILQLGFGVSYPGRLVRKLVPGVTPAIKESGCNVNIKWLSSPPTSAVCNEVIAKYKSNKMSVFAGSLSLYLCIYILTFIITSNNLRA